MKKTILLTVLLSVFFGTPKSIAQEVYVGQILAVAFNYAPPGFQQCNGQMMNISQYQALYALLGTSYGGNGVNTFALPDLRGREIVGVGNGGIGNVTNGQKSGAENLLFNVANLPAHSHTILANSGVGTTSAPADNFMANTGALDKEYNTTANTLMNSTNNTGSNVPVSIMKPYSPVYYIIATTGYFPSHP